MKCTIQEELSSLCAKKANFILFSGMKIKMLLAIAPLYTPINTLKYTVKLLYIVPLIHSSKVFIFILGNLQILNPKTY